MMYKWATFITLCVVQINGYVIVDPELGVDPETLLPNVDTSGINGLSATGLYCNTGTRQSPIDIPYCVQKSLSALRIEGHSDIRPEGFTMLNTGSTAQISYNGLPVPTLSGGPLPKDSTYEFVQAHFHWGNDNVEGTEHAIHDTYGALEIHFVHRKSTYSDLATAIQHSDGLAVFGIIFSEQATNNTRLDKIIPNLANIITEGTTTTLDEDAMVWLDEVISAFQYYNYPGSLTTGDCNEVVNWIVMKRKIGISAAQVAKFRNLIGKDGYPIEEYRRHIQNLNNRVIKCARKDTSRFH
ncbi:carbonic anhydrase 2-like [Cloeon dipterum]|uniref:carbonic anhydrase 2-like n=1 Tax=Cloeon dipterum TaxID=197152 RepID=UPI00322088AC